MLLKNMGYLYDSSVHSTPFLSAYFAYLFIKSGGKTPWKPRLFNNFSAPLTPYHPLRKNIHVESLNPAGLIELPINVTPGTRIPFFGTFQFATKSKRLFDYSLKRLVRAKIPLNYELHSVELYDAKNDKTRFNIKHPCVIQSLKDKLAMYEYMFEKFKKHYDLVPLKELAEETLK